MAEADFERADANAWISTEGPVGICHVTTVQTIWRASTTEPWNDRMVSTAPEARKGDQPCSRMAGTLVEEYTWRNVRRRDLGCRYIRI